MAGRKTEDLTGQRFGRLVVLRRAPSNRAASWVCACDCSSEKSVRSHALRSGSTTSCGCFHKEVTAARNKTFARGPDLQPRQSRQPPERTAPGRTARSPRKAAISPAYGTWVNMIRRCTNPKDPHYPRWGGRGITVCDRWMKFENFLADMGERPDGMTLERKDNERGYEPGNCEWATWATQARNKRSTKLTREKVLEIQRLRRDYHSISRLASAVGLDRHLVGTICTVLMTLEDPAQ